MDSVQDTYGMTIERDTLSASSLEFYSLLDVAVATTPKGALHAKSPFGITMAPYSAEHSTTN
jgi:hypothetical protein